MKIEHLTIARAHSPENCFSSKRYFVAWVNNTLVLSGFLQQSNKQSSLFKINLKLVSNFQEALLSMA
ncbi:CGH_1_collapsed_G0015480.mRNA.1.CDS.1 [Saccharomyces cerevisiae]|nr:CGH_1_collapsed_G0015480.mRNA.1.CDS.1 [Saccharomyces cerevisiae]